MGKTVWVRRSRWIQVVLLLTAAAGFAIFGPGGIGPVAGLGLLVLTPALFFVDDPSTARGLPVATATVVAVYIALLSDYRHDALGDAFAFIAFLGPMPALVLLFQAICLGIARALPKRGNAR